MILIRISIIVCDFIKKNATKSFKGKQTSCS